MLVLWANCFLLRGKLAMQLRRDGHAAKTRCGDCIEVVLARVLLRAGMIAWAPVQ